MSTVKFPPDMPAKLGKFVEIEVIDANTFKLKNKVTGYEIGIMTKAQLEAAIQSVATSPSQGR